MECCNGVCTSLNTNANCGACGNMCPSGSSCINRMCQCASGQPMCSGACCTTGQTCCGGICTDLNGDENNCGQCGRVCPPGTNCAQGNCICATPCDGSCCSTGQGCCDGACTNLDTVDNCGTCGHACLDGQGCCDQLCRPLTGSDNCGQCGNICPSGSECTGNACLCTSSGLAPCNGQCCPLGAQCVGNTCVCAENGHTPCNGQCCQTGQLCCGGICKDILGDRSNCGNCGLECPTGANCVDGVCLCDISGTPPCNGACCPAGLLGCCSNTCTDLQSDGQNCGRCGNTCLGPEVCVGGVCTVPPPVITAK